MKTLLSIIIAAALITQGGCVSVQERRADLKRRFPNLDQSTIDCIARGCVTIGWSKTLVKLSVGMPPSWDRHTISTSSGQVEIWEYGTPPYAILYFIDGKVVRMWTY